jgi:hypothetical protein
VRDPGPTDREALPEDAVNLYHFTGARFLPGIQADGLTRGVVPMAFEPPTFLGGLQWLTIDSGFAQSWCEQQIAIKYRRDDVRLTVRIPKTARDRVLMWLEWKGLTPLGDLLSAYGDPHNWRLFRGRIPPSWIRAVDWNPSRARPVRLNPAPQMDHK